MPNYLVVGGAGFIGSSLVRRLVATQETVTVFDNLSTGKKANLAAVAGDITFIRGDIRNQRAILRAMRGIEYVFHEAALTSVQQSMDDPNETAEVNIQGTINVLAAARDAGARRLVFASSSAVYGNHERGAAQESITPLPISPYGVSKLTGEHYCRIFSQFYGLPTVVLRYFNVFGPGQDFRSDYSAVVPIVLQQILSKQKPTIHGNGRQSRDFTYIDNVVEANLLAVHSSAAKGAPINIAGGKKVTINELVRQLQAILGTHLSPRYLPKRRGDITASYADLATAKRLLGYKPIVSFKEGLTFTTAWYQDNALIT